MTGFIIFGHFFVGPISGQQILDEVIGADRQKICLGCKFVHNFDDAGKLNQCTHQRFAVVGNIFPLKLGALL